MRHDGMFVPEQRCEMSACLVCGVFVVVCLLVICFFLLCGM